MIHLAAVTHCIKTNTLEATWRDSETLVAVKCTNYSPTQADMLRADDLELTGLDSTQRYITAAGWTPEFVSAYTLEQERLAAEVKAKADAEAKEKADAEAAAKQAAFAAAIAEQVAILEAAKQQVAASA